MTTPDTTRTDGAAQWATRVIDGVYRTLGRTRVEACEHIISSAVLADLELDLDPSAAGPLPGAAQVPAAILCGRHLDRITCAACHAEHLDQAHRRQVRCRVCNAPGATETRSLTLALSGPLGIVHHSVPAKLGGLLQLDPALELCPTCAEQTPQDQLHPLHIVVSDRSHRP